MRTHPFRCNGASIKPAHLLLQAVPAPYRCFDGRLGRVPKRASCVGGAGWCANGLAILGLVQPCFLQRMWQLYWCH
jgi:hypothetical protein